MFTYIKTAQIKNFFVEHKHNTRRWLFALLILVLGVGVAFTMYTRTATAGPGLPFGGMVGTIFPCTCSANYIVYFADLAVPPSSLGALIYQPGATITYAYGPPYRPGQWMLGTWLPGGVCLIWVLKICVPVPVTGTMFMVGTSV